MVGTIAEKERAKQIVIEIIRQAGGVFRKKTNLYKAFYYAHLEYAKANADYLSHWPIVRMPQGPGIHNFDAIVGELLLTGHLHISEPSDEKASFIFELLDTTPSTLTPQAVSAIERGVAIVSNKSASQVSDESHRASRAWRESKNGQPLHIYNDLLDDADFESLMSDGSKLAAELLSSRTLAS